MYIKVNMLKEKIKANKGSGKGLEQLMKETDEDFKERRRLAKLSPQDLAKEQVVQQNKTVESLNKPIPIGKPLPKKPKSEYEKSFENLGFKAPIASTTNFSPQVNVNMGGVVIKNEADLEKTAEMSKQKIMAELKNYVQITN